MSDSPAVRARDYLDDPEPLHPDGLALIEDLADELERSAAWVRELEAEREGLLNELAEALRMDRVELDEARALVPANEETAE